MNIPLQITCPQCNTSATQRVHLDTSSPDFTCTQCGHQHVKVFDLDLTIGFLLLERSRYELSVEKDYSMAIVLAALAFESELSRLFCKWTRIKQIGRDPVVIEEECERNLRSFGNIAGRIEGVSQMLYSGGIEPFVSSSPEWTKNINNDFPSLQVGSLAKDFQKTVFWPRNKILHAGYAKHTHEDAAKCYSIAYLGVRILQDMDKLKRKVEKL